MSTCVRAPAGTACRLCNSRARRAKRARSPTGERLGLTLDSACREGFRYGDELYLMADATDDVLRRWLLLRKQALRREALFAAQEAQQDARALWLKVQGGLETLGVS